MSATFHNRGVTLKYYIVRLVSKSNWQVVEMGIKCKKKKKKNIKQMLKKKKRDNVIIIKTTVHV